MITPDFQYLYSIGEGEVGAKFASDVARAGGGKVGRLDSAADLKDLAR